MAACRSSCGTSTTAASTTPCWRTSDRMAGGCTGIECIDVLKHEKTFDRMVRQEHLRARSSLRRRLDEGRAKLPPAIFESGCATQVCVLSAPRARCDCV